MSWSELKQAFSEAAGRYPFAKLAVAELPGSIVGRARAKAVQKLFAPAVASYRSRAGDLPIVTTATGDGGEIVLRGHSADQADGGQPPEGERFLRCAWLFDQRVAGAAACGRVASEESRRDGEAAAYLFRDLAADAVYLLNGDREWDLWGEHLLKAALDKPAGSTLRVEKHPPNRLLTEELLAAHCGDDASGDDRIEAGRTVAQFVRETGDRYWMAELNPFRASVAAVRLLEGGGAVAGNGEHEATWMTASDLAAHYGIEDQAQALRQRLKRWRRNNADGWADVPNDARKPRDPKFVYQPEAVRTVIESLLK